MSKARKLLIFGGTLLAAFGMLYGLHYAVFVEHQTLDRMGGSLANAFAHAADRRWDDSQLALTTYRETKYDYVRQVDVHSHWIGLAMLMIVLGCGIRRGSIWRTRTLGDCAGNTGRCNRVSAGSGSADSADGGARFGVGDCRLRPGHCGDGSDGCGIHERQRNLECIPGLFTITAQARYRKRRPCFLNSAMKPRCWLAVRA